METTDRKAEARKAAFAQRKDAKSETSNHAAAVHLSDFLQPHRGKALAGYVPIRTEIDPLVVMADMAEFGPVAVPVIQGAGQPLKFRAWHPGCVMEPGPFGAAIPAKGDWVTPEVLIVPLVAFDANAMRLGYGGGFYDRTLERLRARGPVLAVGFAYGAQQAADLPLEATDQPLDAIVTEAGVLWPQGVAKGE